MAGSSELRADAYQVVSHYSTIVLLAICPLDEPLAYVGGGQAAELFHRLSFRKELPPLRQADTYRQVRIRTRWLF